MSKKLDVSKISNELKNRSLHFARAPVLPLPSIDVPPPSPAPTPTEETAKAVSEIETDVDKSTSTHIDNETSPQVDVSTKKQVHKSTSPQRNKLLKRYTTYFPEEAILAMQRIAFETRRKDYEVFIEAVEKYIKRHGE